MTLKHIDFYDSPVMIELARQAIQKGTVKPLSLDEILKNASDTKVDDCQPSGDLMLDVSRLADGLRSKGYVKEAMSLEAKLMEYKRASKEFSSMLDQAHPEGDVEMGDASSDLGDVETLESAHLKIEEILKKVPTGKQAKAESLLAKTVQILKESQTAPAETTADPYLNDFGNDRSSAHAEQIDAVNKIVDQVYVEVTPLLKQAMDSINPTNLAFTVEKLLVDPTAIKLYSQYAKKDPTTVANFAARYRVIFGLQKPSAQVVYDNLMNLDGTNLTNYVKNGGPGFTAMLPGASNSDATVSSTGDKIIEFVGDVLKPTALTISEKTDKMKALASAIYNKMVEEFNELLGEDSINAATAALRQDIETNISSKLQAIFLAVGNTKKLPPNANSNSYVKAAFDAQLTRLNAFVADENIQKILADVTAVFNVGGALLGFVTGSIIPALTKLSDEVLANPIATADQAVTTEQIDAVYNSFLDSYRKLSTYVTNNGGNNSKIGIDNAPQLARIRAVLDTLTAAKKDQRSKSYAQLFSSIQKALPDATSLQVLEQYAALWNQSITDFTAPKTAAEVLDRILKNAQAVPLPSPGKTVPTAHKPDAVSGTKPGTPAAQPQGQVKQDRRLQTIDGDEKASVIKMQDLMGRIATHTKNPAIGTVGKNGASGSDGAWLGYTSRGLVTIQGLITEHEKKTGQSIGRLETRQMGGLDGAKAAADTNSAILRKYLAAAWKDDAGGDDAPGGLPAGLNPALASLSAFYDYLISRPDDRVTEESRVTKDPTGQESEQRGIDGTKFWMELGEMINWFKEKASPPRPDIVKHLEGLYQQLVDITNRNGLSPDGPRGNIVTKQMLVAPAANRPGAGGVNGQPGQGGGPGGSAYVGRGQGGRGVSDGSDLEISNVEDYPDPIYLRGSSKGDIDLNLEYYSELRQQFPSIPGYLNFRVFTSNSAQDMAKALFSDGMQPGNPYFVTMDGFLNALIKGITAAVNNWEQYAGPVPAERSEMAKHMMRWQRAIQQKKQQLKTSIV